MSSNIQITNLCLSHRKMIRQVAALREVQASFAVDRISRVAIDDNNDVLGWISGNPQYDGDVWELHPLVVRSDCRRKGIGRALVIDLENQVRERDGLTLWFGTDDEDNMTTLGGVDLYPDVWQHIANIKNLHGHPYEFYQKVGFVIVGVMPAMPMDWESQTFLWLNVYKNCDN